MIFYGSQIRDIAKRETYLNNRLKLNTGSKAEDQKTRVSQAPPLSINPSFLAHIILV
jgi:hypothetical protein